MNIYFFFSVSEKLFSNLAIELKKIDTKYRFFGGAYAKSNYISSNNLFEKVRYFSELSMIGDIDESFLLRIEKIYQIRISDLIHMDRHLAKFSRQRKLYFAQQIIKVLIEDLDKNGINVVIAHAISDFASYFLWVFCKEHKITFLYPITARIGSRMYFSDSPNTGLVSFDSKFNKNKKLYESSELDLDLTIKFCKRYLAEKTTVKIGVSSVLLFRIISREDIKVFFRLFKIQFNGVKGLIYERWFLSLPYYRIKRICQAYCYQKIISKRLFIEDGNSKYVVFPLQFHPEASTLIIGKTFNDQLRLIELISKGLPVNVKIIIKEHPVCVGRREPEFFKFLLKLHNTYFVPHNYDNYKLLSNSLGLITLSSSMAIEAFILKKPVIVFGDVFYDRSKNSFKVFSMKDFPKIFDQMENHVFDEEEMLIFFKTILDESFDFDPISFDKEMLRIFVDKCRTYLQD